MSNINIIATLSFHHLPFSSTKFQLISSIDIKTKTLITNISHQTNNKTKERRLLTPSLLTTTLYSLSQKLLNNAFRVTYHSAHGFSGNFAPAEELEPTDCEVIEGQIPLTLNGVYIQNGPNDLRRQPRHVLDLFFVDGMLHCLQLSNGNARYCNRFVKTHKYTLERDANSPIVLSGTSLCKIGYILRYLIVGKSQQMRLPIHPHVGGSSFFFSSFGGAFLMSTNEGRLIIHCYV